MLIRPSVWLPFYWLMQRTVSLLVQVQAVADYPVLTFLAPMLLKMNFLKMDCLTRVGQLEPSQLA
ncbi:hypothetical protein KCO_08715 [Pectobacterium brasiliense ICMP 19477]|uniref:Uncharacterized protein n=1 Tax=Pectobacterium brasiliense TaxID=180957 RepID=M4GX48_9GAMM|nr:hypothetical protein KCO_08715 [Pectobacterium brasiliense]KMK84142.1 hypothetical protein KCO_08715 [Pectobacterium brasiliense ICMP 19477]